MKDEGKREMREGKREMGKGRWEIGNGGTLTKNSLTNRTKTKHKKQKANRAKNNYFILSNRSNLVHIENKYFLTERSDYFLLLFLL